MVSLGMNLLADSPVYYNDVQIPKDLLPGTEDIFPTVSRSIWQNEAEEFFFCLVLNFTILTKCDDCVPMNRWLLSTFEVNIL